MARNLLLPVFTLAALLLATQSCQDTGTDPLTDDGDNGASTDTVLFSAQVYPIFSKSQYGCNGCHSGTGNIAWYGTSSAATRSNLVNVDANTGPCAGNKRVLPGDADNSVLYRRLAGATCGDQMPQGGSPIASTDLALIRDWINQGAVNN